MSCCWVWLTKAPRRSSKKPVLAVDLDEVCCGYVAAFAKYNNEVHGTSVTVDDFVSYLFWEVPGCKLSGREDAIQRVYAFHASSYFDLIAPLPGAKEALQRLCKMFDLHIVTSRQNELEEKTRQFVAKHFPNIFSDMHFGNHFGKADENGKVQKVSKPEMCQRIGAVALIDDSLDYTHQCAAAGIPSFLFTGPKPGYAWNRPKTTLPPLVTPVAEWAELLDLVTPEKLKLASA